MLDGCAERCAAVRGRMDDWEREGKDPAAIMDELRKMPPHLFPPMDTRGIGFEMGHPTQQLDFYEHLMSSMPATHNASS